MKFEYQRLIPAVAAIGAFAAGFMATSASAAQDPTGVWLNDTGRGAIEIKNCNGGLCGHVVWVKAGADSMGCGKQIIGEVTSSGDGLWGGGWIYNPDKKKRYDVELEPQGNGTLKVTGFAGIRFLSKTMYWKKAPADLERCNSGDAAAAPAVAPAKVTKAEVAPSAAAVAPAKVAAAPAVEEVAKPKQTAPVGVEQEAETSGDSIDTSNINLDDGIEVGDVFSMKKQADGKCKIKAPFVDLVVDCNRKDDGDDD